MRICSNCGNEMVIEPKDMSIYKAPIIVSCPTCNLWYDVYDKHTILTKKLHSFCVVQYAR